MVFGSLTIHYDDRVLRPRPWTQEQSRLAARLLATAPEGPVLELCSGAGQIGLLAVLGHDRELVLVDADPVACEHARRNVAAAGHLRQTEVRCAPLESALSPGERFALIVADPPWVRSARIAEYPEDPVTAIDGGTDGLDIARACLRTADQHLLLGGSMVLQVGSVAQAQELTAWTEQADIGLRTLDLHDFPDQGTLLVLTPTQDR